MFGIHPLFFVALLIVVLIIFGPGKLPEVGGAVGKAMREFRKATTEVADEVKKSVETPPPAAGDSSASKAEAPKS